MGKAPKTRSYYAVARRKQHTGSVYASWNDAQPHTTGVSGAQCKGCDTLSEVQEYFKKHGIDMKDVMLLFWRLCQLHLPRSLRLHPYCVRR